MRLLPIGSNHVGGSAAHQNSSPDDSDIDAAMAGNFAAAAPMYASAKLSSALRARHKRRQ